MGGTNESRTHPSAGGETWSADLGLGAKTHQLIGDYWARIAGASAADRFRLLVELAGKLYDLHALKRIELVRPGHVEDASAFDTEHPIRASLAVWQPLMNFPLEDAERQAIDRALAACRSRWMSEALRRVSPTPGLSANASPDPHPASPSLPQARDWSEIIICFLSEHRVRITIRNQSETRNYAEMGFASKKNGTPMLAWEELYKLALRGGAFRATGDSQQWGVLEKRIQEIRRKLKAHFHLSDDPIPFVKKTRNQDIFGYHAEFHISCDPSAEF